MFYLLPIRQHTIRQQVKCRIGFTAIEVYQQREHGNPIGNSRGPATTHSTHCRQAEFAVNKNIIERQIKQRTHQRERHDDAGMAESIGEPAQRC